MDLVEDRSSNRKMIARAALAAACAVGLWFVARALLNPELEWRLLMLCILAFALSPFKVEIRTSGDQSIRIPLIHCTLFASALALGPAGAALPAVFAGISRLFVSSVERRPLHHIIFAFMKPAVISTAASFAFATSGGNVMRLDEVGASLPILCAGLAYLSVGAIMAGAVEEIHPRESVPSPQIFRLVAAWCSCFITGYLIAVLYSVVPSYVVVAPAICAGLVGIALRQNAQETKPLSSQQLAEELVKSDPDMAASFVDPATGLANQRYLEMFLKRELGRAERLGKDVSVAIFDLDETRKFFDHETKDSLDRAIREIGLRLKEGLREYDILVRYSAARLVVVLPEIPSDQAYEVAERLHKSLSSIIFNKKTVSVSVGIASFPDYASNVDELINAAHRALNRGRFNGPNSIFSCENLDQAS